MARKLRIVVSGFFGVLTLLLVDLWVRSYWCRDQLIGPAPHTGAIYLNSSCGMLVYYLNGRGGEDSWSHQRYTPHPVGSNWRFEELWYSDQFDRASLVPYWMPDGILAILASLPWISARFSLRTLLIGTTLLAVVLGLVVWAGR